MQRMRKSWCTIMKFFWNSLNPVYRFLEFEWMFLIGICSVISKEAIGIEILPWIALEVSLQFWVFREKFQVLFPVFSAAACVLALGFHSSLCSEQIRLTKLIKISFIHEFEDLIFHHYFPNIFHVLFVQIISNLSKSFYIWMCTNYRE